MYTLKNMKLVSYDVKLDGFRVNVIRLIKRCHIFVKKIKLGLGTFVMIEFDSLDLCPFWFATWCLYLVCNLVFVFVLRNHPFVTRVVKNALEIQDARIISFLLICSTNARLELFSNYAKSM